jgi:hypothetical protein
VAVLGLDVALFHLINVLSGSLVLNRIFTLDGTFLFLKGGAFLAMYWYFCFRMDHNATRTGGRLWQCSPGRRWRSSST